MLNRTTQNKTAESPIFHMLMAENQTGSISCIVVCTFRGSRKKPLHEAVPNLVANVSKERTLQNTISTLKGTRNKEIPCINLRKQLLGSLEPIIHICVDFLRAICLFYGWLLPHVFGIQMTSAHCFKSYSGFCPCIYFTFCKLPHLYSHSFARDDPPVHLSDAASLYQG